MPTQFHHIRRLAVALAAGPMNDPDDMKTRIRPLVGAPGKSRWLPALLRNLSAVFADGPRPTWRQVADEISDHQPFFTAWSKGSGRMAANVSLEPQMIPAPGAPQLWQVPPITTLNDLASALQLHPDDLGWLTAPSRTEHYLHQWKRKGKSGRHRLLEIPKPLLKIAQRAVLGRILECIPPHEAAEGFRRGRSIRNFVGPHCNRPMVLRMDLEEFFPSIASPQVLKVFLTAGYPEDVSVALTRLCTHSMSPSVLRERPLIWREQRRLSAAHLPQGAPTSPALANLCAFRLDCRLAGLAQSAGAQYTRYADDLLFSGGEDFARQSRRFESLVNVIILEQGFRPNNRKTRFLGQSQRQQAAGVVLNEKPNLSRQEFDRLKAILTNCRRHGPRSQNRDGHDDFQAHLRGRIAWHSFVNTERGARLSALYQRVNWASQATPSL